MITGLHEGVPKLKTLSKIEEAQRGPKENPPSFPKYGFWGFTDITLVMIQNPHITQDWSIRSLSVKCPTNKKKATQTGRGLGAPMSPLVEITVKVFGS